MTRLASLCLYCGSATGHDGGFSAAAARLGSEAARRGVRLIFGGGRVGLMGVAADAALAAGGEVIGVIPEHLEQREVGHRGISRLEVVDSMHSRKMRMFELSDAFCALPGGLGTLDETFEIVTWKQLGLHDKPVVLLDLKGYWQPLIRLLEHQVAAGFVKPQHARLFTLVDSVEAVFEAIEKAPGPALEGDSSLL